MTPKERLKQIQETHCPTCRKYKRCRPFMLITMDKWVCLFHKELHLSDDDRFEEALAAAIDKEQHTSPLITNH